MWPYFPELLATPVPRYTSFPTAAEFTEGVGPADHLAALEQLTGDVSLYVHIPFCEKICWYCGCNTGAANRWQRVSTYLDALHREIALTAEKLAKTVRIRRISFGGGSPNAISPTDFVRLIDALTLHFAVVDPEISIELDPRSLCDSWGAVIEGIGAAHASLGVQTFSSRAQAAIGRVQPEEDIARSVALLRDAGITSLNFDLMYGLPGQTMAELAETLDRTARLGADRIALFGYAHVPHLVPRQRQIDASALPDQHLRFAMAEEGFRQLVDAGYAPVGFDHFALPGDPLAQAALTGRLRRNFQGFTNDQSPATLGFGASAISSFPGLISQNEKNSGRYGMLLSQGNIPAALGLRRSSKDRIIGAVIEGLLCNGRARLERALLAQTYRRLVPFLEHGLARLDGEILTVSPDALPYTRSIAAQFDPYRVSSPRQFSSAV